MSSHSETPQSDYANMVAAASATAHAAIGGRSVSVRAMLLRWIDLPYPINHETYD